MDRQTGPPIKVASLSASRYVVDCLHCTIQNHGWEGRGQDGASHLGLFILRRASAELYGHFSADHGDLSAQFYPPNNRAFSRYFRISALSTLMHLPAHDNHMTWLHQQKASKNKHLGEFQRWNTTPIGRKETGKVDLFQRSRPTSRTTSTRSGWRACELERHALAPRSAMSSGNSCPVHVQDLRSNSEHWRARRQCLSYLRP